MYRSVFLYLIAALIGQGSYFVVAPLVLNLFGDIVYAEIELFFTYSQFILYLIGLNIYTSITRKKFESLSNTEHVSYSANIFIYGIFVFVLINLCLLIIPAGFLEEILRLEINIIRLLPFGFIIMFLTAWLQNYLTVNKQPFNYAKFQISNGLIKIISVLFVFYILNKVTAFHKIFAEVFLLFVSLSIIILIITNKKININNFKSDIKYGILFSAPLLLYVFSVNILNFSDQIFIDQILGKKELSLYSFSYRFSFIVVIFYTAISNYFSIDYYSYFENKDAKRNLNMTLFLNIIILLFSFILILISEYFLKILTSWSQIDINISLNIIKIIVLSYYIHTYYLIWSRKLFYNKNTLLISLVVFPGAVLNLILNYFLIPIYGLMGAAYSTFFSIFLIYFLSLIISRFKKFRIDIKIASLHLVGFLFIFIIFLA